MEIVIKKCMHCGAVVKAIEDCNCEDCGIKCCGEPMKNLTPNTSDGAAEKHVPMYEILGDVVEARVEHVMEEDHYIEWISASYEDKEVVKYLKPGEEAKEIFDYVPGMVIYAYCNKHLLWKTTVE